MISWFGHSERLANCSVEHVVDTFQITDWDFDKTRGVYRHAFSNILPLEPSLHVSCDILVKAIMEAKKGMPVEGGVACLIGTWRWAPPGVVEDTIWWTGASRYYGGRAPMPRMAELPDDALRGICEQLVPPVMRSNEEFMTEAREYCDERTTDAALLACDEEGLGDLLVEGDNLRLELVGRLREWHRGRAPVAVQLRLVSRHWRRAREKPTNDLRAELARLKQHKVMLDIAFSRVRWAFLSRFGPEY